MERLRPRSLAFWWLLLLSLLTKNLVPCSSINDEGRALLRFRERVEVHPNAVLSDSVATEGTDEACVWFGIECENGDVVALNHGNPTNRRLLQLKTERNDHKVRKKRFLSPSPAPSPTFLPILSSPGPSPFPAPLSPQASSHPPIFSSPAIPPAPSPLRLPSSRDPRNQELSPSTSLELPHSLPGHAPTLLPSPILENPLSHDHNHTVHPRAFSTLFRTPSRSHPHLKTHVLMFLGVGAGGFGLVALLIICIDCYQKKVVAVRPWATGLSGQLQKAFVTGVPQLKRSELETACEDFSNIIGSPSDCILYKGTLSSGVEIAVASTVSTSAKDWSKHSEARFKNKITTLSKVNHKNFVNLLGYCKEEEPFTRMMVFEYAPNGTLFEHLHVKEAEDLNWTARLRIAMGIAYCLDHMHQLNASVVLRNLQSSSIYLTDDFAAKISDFEFSSQTALAVAACGNSGPFHEPTPSPESIVYKFGILLLEIISGRLPYSEDSGLLLGWASDFLRESDDLGDIIDPTMGTVGDEVVHAICEVIHHCCTSEPRERPTMKEVAGQLRDVTAVPPDGAVPKLSPLWWAELEILSTEAN